MKSSKITLPKFFLSLLPWLVVTFFVYLSSRAMFHEGFFRTIDDVTTVRIDYMAKELKLGRWIDNFPVRLGSEMAHTYGYPFYLFYAPLVYYVGAAAMILGNLNQILATKLVYVLPLIIGPYIFYWAIRHKLKIIPSLVSSLFFALFPYRGFDTYFRGGVGESWAMAFLPGLIGAFFAISQNKKYGYILLSIVLAIIAVSHNISGLMVLGVTILYGLLFHTRDVRYWFATILGLGLSAFFWLPSVSYLHLIRANTLPLNTNNIFTALVPLSRLITPYFTYSTGASYISAFFYLLVIGTLYFIYKKYNKLEKSKVLFWFILSLLLYLSMSYPFSWVWQLTLPVTRMLQFPWRVLIILSVTVPLCLGYLLDQLSNKSTRYLIIALSIVMNLVFLPTFQPKEYSYYFEYKLEDTGPCATGDFEDYFPAWVKSCIDKKPASDMFLAGGGKLNWESQLVSDMRATYTTEKDDVLMVHRYYFPGWKVELDQSEIPLEYGYIDSGLFKVNVPSGNHTLRVYFTKTLLMKIADLITILSVIGLIYWLRKITKGNRNEKNT